MGMRFRRAGVVLAGVAVVLVCSEGLRSIAEGSRQKQKAPQAAKELLDKDAPAKKNSIGVAYMGQQRFADAQKEFEGALAIDKDYALAKLNLGISFLAQQKSDAARAALTEATEKRAKDPYAWYNLGLVEKDSGATEKAILAFKRVTEIAPNEPDAYYFIGYLSTQMQKYDEAIAAFQKAVAIFPYHASAEFGLARAFQRKGDGDAAREHLQKFQRMQANKMGVVFGAGYGDQGKFSLAEYAQNALLMAPAAIPVKFSSGAIPVS